MKKVICLALIFIMALGALPALAFDDSVAYGMTFRQEGNKAVIVGIARNTAWLTIPPTLGNLEVDIDPDAFRGNSGITSVTFEYGWKKIPDGACRDMSALTNVTIPASVEEIGAYAFSGTGIKEVNITNAKTIGEGAFSYCVNLTNVRIPQSVKTIGNFAFAGCESLGEINLEDTETVGARAFENCTSLHTISHNGKIVSIGEDCFYGCPDISEDEANALISGYKVDTYSMTIPPYSETATRPTGIYFMEFEVGSPNYQYEVRNYASGETYAYIKKYHNMDYYYVPETFEGYNVLYGGCYYQDGFYYYSDKNRLPHATLAGIATGFFKGDTLVIPNAVGVELVVGANYSWVDNSHFKKFDLSMFFDVPDQILANCRKVQEVTLSPMVETIGDRAFAGDINLKEIELPETLNKIGAFAFYNTGLEAVTIPKNVEYIGASAFAECKQLKKVVIEDGTRLVIDKDAFLNIASDAQIFIERDNIVTEIDWSKYNLVEKDDFNVSVSENAVWAWGGKYGEEKVKLLDNIVKLEEKSAGMYGADNSYYAICSDKSLYVWGAHGFYANLMPVSKPSKYTYIGGMLGLPCNDNVAPVSMGPAGSIDESQYEAVTPNQKVPVKLLDNVEELVFGAGGGVFALCDNGEVYAWGNHWGNDEDKSPKLLNTNGKKIYLTGTCPALYDGRAAVLEKDNTLSVYGYGCGDGRQLSENVKAVCTAMYPSSYQNAILFLTDDNVLWESSGGKIIRVMDYVHAIEKKSGKIYIMQKDGTVYERVYINSKAENVVTENENLFENMPVTVYVNGKMIETDTEPYIKNNRTMVPMRAIFEALGAAVEWFADERIAEGRKGDVSVSIKIGDKVLYRNGEGITLDAAAEIKNNRTMVPVRAISEAFGCTVEWDDKTMSVMVTVPDSVRWDYTAYAETADKVTYTWRSEDSANSGTIEDAPTIKAVLEYLAEADLERKVYKGVWTDSAERLNFSIYVKSNFGHSLISCEVNDTDILITAFGEVSIYEVKNMKAFRDGWRKIFR